MTHKYVIYSTKNKNLVLAICALISLSACQSGLSVPSFSEQDSRDVTPRTKGPTLEITPRTKGSTLLMGQVIWPAEAQPLADTRFLIEILTSSGKLSLETGADGRFAFTDLPTQSPLRLIATAIAQPILKLKADLQIPAGQSVPGFNAQITVESTAVSALMDYAQQAESSVPTLTIEAFADPAMRSVMTPISESIMQILSSKEKMDNLSQALESQPEVRLSLEQSLRALETMQHSQPDKLK